MRVLICGLLKVPCGDAGSIRQHKLSIMCQQLGHEVLLVGLGKSNGMKPQEYEGIRYISLREGGNSFKDKAASRLRYWMRLKRVLKDYMPDAIIMDDLGTSRTIRIKHYCKKKNIRLIHDSVEWYSPEQFKHGRLSLNFLKKNLLNRVLIDKNCSVIAISTYLEQHFLNKGCNCVRIPIVITENDLCYDKEVPDDKTVFTYAGQPGKKDYLHVMLDAFALLPQEMLNKVEFNIVGCTKQQMIASGISSTILQKLEKQLVVHGHVSHNEVLDILRKTHFTLLMRSPIQRYAKAGFPTKVVESVSRSTPVICNITSDLGMYLTDDVDSLHVPSCDPEALKVVLEKAISMPRSDKIQMCKRATLAAKKHFMHKNFQTKLAETLRLQATN